MNTGKLFLLFALLPFLSPAQSFAPGEWPRSQDPYDTARIEALCARIADSSFKDITSFAIIKNGALLCDRYFNGATPETLHDPRSVSKTIASAVTGIALQEGHLKNVNETLDHFYPLRRYQHYSPVKASVQLRHLLSMSSGFLGSDMDEHSPGNEENMYPQPDWVHWALNLPMDSSRIPGQRWDYFTAGVVILGDILNKKVPGGLERYADKKLFAPLGIRRYQWQYTPQRVPNTAGGLRMCTLDYARFGQLYQNKGVWKGQRILDSAWVRQSLSRQIAIPEEGMYYGYLWWNKTYRVNGRDYETYACSGNGGNKIFVFVNEPVVVVVTATAYNKPYAHRQVNKMMEEYIIPALRLHE